jgi:hypothetical protein
MEALGENVECTNRVIKDVTAGALLAKMPGLNIQVGADLPGNRPGA